MNPTPPHPTPGRRLNLNHEVDSACLRDGLTRKLVDEKINISRPEKLAHAEAGSQSGLISDVNSTLRQDYPGYLVQQQSLRIRPVVVTAIEEGKNLWRPSLKNQDAVPGGQGFSTRGASY